MSKILLKGNENISTDLATLTIGHGSRKLELFFTSIPSLLLSTSTLKNDTYVHVVYVTM